MRMGGQSSRSLPDFFYILMHSVGATSALSIAELSMGAVEQKSTKQTSALQAEVSTRDIQVESLTRLSQVYSA